MSSGSRVYAFQSLSCQAITVSKASERTQQGEEKQRYVVEHSGSWLLRSRSYKSPEAIQQHCDAFLPFRCQSSTALASVRGDAPGTQRSAITLIDLSITSLGCQWDIIAGASRMPRVRAEWYGLPLMASHITASHTLTRLTEPCICEDALCTAAAVPDPTWLTSPSSTPRQPHVQAMRPHVSGTSATGAMRAGGSRIETCAAQAGDEVHPTYIASTESQKRATARVDTIPRTLSQCGF